MRIKFFCDIEGTFTTKESDEERLFILNQFVSFLEQLAPDNGIEFSFVSTHDMLTVMNYYNELLNVINHQNANIVLGNQYAEDCVYKHGIIEKCCIGKVAQISQELEMVKEGKVFFADDTPLMCVMVKGIINRRNPLLEVVIFTQESQDIKGLTSVNNALMNYINQQKLVRMKKD